MKRLCENAINHANKTNENHAETTKLYKMHNLNTLITHTINDVGDDLGGIGSPVSHNGNDTNIFLSKVIHCNVNTRTTLFRNNGVVSENIITDRGIIRMGRVIRVLRL